MDLKILFIALAIGAALVIGIFTYTNIKPGTTPTDNPPITTPGGNPTYTYPTPPNDEDDGGIPVIPGA